MVSKKRKRTKKLPEKSQFERMQEVLASLKELLPEEDLEVIDVKNHKGMIFHQVDILAGMDSMKLDPIGISGVMVECFRNKFGVEPEWFTKFNSGASIVVVLGPVPVSTTF